MEVGACLLATVRGVLPPNPCIERAGHDCELNHVVKPNTPFAGDYILSNSFGFGGQNASLVLRRI